MTRHRTLGAALAAAALVLVLAPGAVRALSPGEIRSQAQAIGAEWDRLRQNPASPVGAESPLIERLGSLVLAFIEECDDTARAGNERQSRDALRAAFEALYGPLNGIYDARGGDMERRARKIMDEDGDLEALYETAEWQQSQTVAAQALYYLNWLDLYGGRLQEGARRRELFEAAERGFSQFAVGDRKGELITESLLGRGLAHLELGNSEWAVRDFRLVVDDPKVSPERKAKARLALLDAYARSGKPKDTLEYTESLLRAGDLGSDAALVRYFRLQAMLDALKGASGAQADTYRREAVALMDQLRGAGKGWAGKVDALMATRIDDPAKWVGKAQTVTAKWELAKLLLQKGDEAAAAPLLAEVAASDRAEAKPLRAEASYWLGVARFKGGDFAAAAPLFEAALADPSPAFAAEAAYLRFKALETLMAREATAELTTRYAAAMTELLDKYPLQPLAYEARYRLGELRQSQGEFAAAIADYAKVAGDPGFELRARFGTLQCEFELYKAAADPAARTARLSSVGTALTAFWERARPFEAKKDRGDLPLEEFEAKATVMQAVYLQLRGGEPADGEVAKLLADFETHFPAQKELLPQAVRLRLGALRQLGQFAEAEREVTRHAAVLREEGRRDALDGLAASYAKAGARLRAEGKSDDAQAAQRVALQLYDTLDTGDGPKDDKRQLTRAQLAEATGDRDGAAKVYEELLAGNANSLAAIGGLARLAEARGDRAAALEFWKRYTAVAPPGNAPWFHGQYQQARLMLAGGDKQASCALLTQLRPAMPGLSDADLRQQLGQLYKEACE